MRIIATVENREVKLYGPSRGISNGGLFSPLTGFVVTHAGRTFDVGNG